MKKFIWTLRVAYLYVRYAEFNLLEAWKYAKSISEDGYFEDGYSPRDAFNDEVSCWSE